MSRPLSPLRFIAYVAWLVAVLVTLSPRTAAAGSAHACAALAEADRPPCVAVARALYETALALPNVKGFPLVFETPAGPRSKDELTQASLEDLDQLSARYGTCLPLDRGCKGLSVELRLTADPFAVGLMGGDYKETLKRERHLIVTRQDTVQPGTAEAHLAVGDVAFNEVEWTALKLERRPAPRAASITLAGSRALVDAFIAAFPQARVLRALGLAAAP